LLVAIFNLEWFVSGVLILKIKPKFIGRLRGLCRLY
jgi:hypothetical protein